MDLLIKNGTIITASDTYQADLAVKDGRVAIIGQGLDFTADQVIDAAGKYVLPGAIDAHVHLETPVGEFVSADDYESGTRAAACGGVTMVFDFAVQGFVVQFRQVCLEVHLFGSHTQRFGSVSCCFDFANHPFDETKPRTQHSAQ